MAEAKLTKDSVARKFSAASTKEVVPGPQLPPSMWEYRQAAAVLSWFEPDTLQPYGRPRGDDSSAITQLLAESGVMYDQDNHPRWILRSDMRREALRRLRTREAMRAALAANGPGPDDEVQRVLRLVFDDQLPPLEEQSLDTLMATLQVVRWLDGIVEPLPTVEDVQGWLDWERLLKSFRWLVSDDFCGRDRELAELREYVGVLPAGTVKSKVIRRVRAVLNLTEEPPLVIFGPGGIGKSTLLAKFILEHVEGETSFPFTYIDFDRPDLTAEEPATILVEAMRQLGIQFTQTRAMSIKARDHWLREISRPRIDPAFQSASYGAENMIQTSLHDRTPLLDDLARILDTIGKPDQPFLLVLDTFEQVQYRSRDFVVELWQLLNELQERVPRLRTVISGRAPIREFKTRELALGDLEPAAAECLLKTHGITDPQLVTQIVRQVGGNPLSLELAVEVVEREGIGASGVKDVAEWKRLMLELRENSIQGYLYRRLLSRIDDADVCKLAHPGLILHFITPDLILNVLAVPCEVEVHDMAGAQRLFDKLQEEVTLVTVEPDGSLRHRSDVRRIMLPALAQDEPLKVMDIHKRAADYFHAQSGPQARAEEIYHRLFFETDLSKLNSLWEAGVEKYLGGSLEEVPETAQPWLASRLGVTWDYVMWDSADLEVWERYAERRARDLMGYGKWQEALDVMRERDRGLAGNPPYTAGSRLYLLEAEALEKLGRAGEARQVVKSGIYSASKTDNNALLLDLLRLSARLDEQAKRYEPAKEALKQALERVPPDDDVLRLDLTVSLLRLHRLGPPRDPAEVSARLEEAVGLFDKVAGLLPRENLPLLRDVAVEVGSHNPQVLQRAIQIARPPTRLTQPQRDALSGALTTWDTAASRQLRAKPGELARALGLEVVGDLGKVYTGFLQQIDPPTLLRAVDRLMAKFPVPADVARVLVDNLLAEEAAPESAL